MPRLLTYLLGPEAWWIGCYVACGWLVAGNQPATPGGNTGLERACLAGAFLATALTFTVFAVPGPNRWVLLVRVLLAVGIGLNACLFRLIDGINYGDSRNSGLLGLWFYGVMLGGLALAPGAMVTVWWLRRAVAAAAPVLPS